MQDIRNICLGCRPARSRARKWEMARSGFVVAWATTRAPGSGPENVKSVLLGPEPGHCQIAALSLLEVIRDSHQLSQRPGTRLQWPDPCFLCFFLVFFLSVFCVKQRKADEASRETSSPPSTSGSGCALLDKLALLRSSSETTDNPMVGGWGGAGGESRGSQSVQSTKHAEKHTHTENTQNTLHIQNAPEARTEHGQHTHETHRTRRT